MTSAAALSAFGTVLQRSRTRVGAIVVDPVVPPIIVPPIILPPTNWVPNPKPIVPNVCHMRPMPPYPRSPGTNTKHVQATACNGFIYMRGGDYENAHMVNGTMFPGFSNSHEEMFRYEVAKDDWQIEMSFEDAAAMDATGSSTSPDGKRGPIGRCLSGFEYDSVRKGIWMTRGQVRQGWFKNLSIYGLWFYPLPNPTKKWIYVGCEAGQNTYLEQALAVDTVNGRLLFMGYCGAAFNAAIPGLLSINPDDPAETSKPGWDQTRYGYPTLQLPDDVNISTEQIAHDKKRNELIVYSPQQHNTYAISLNEPGKYTILSNQKLPTQSRWLMDFDQDQDCAVIIGGLTKPEGAPGGGVQNALCVLERSGPMMNNWLQYNLPGLPSARSSGKIVYDETNFVHVISGGRVEAPDPVTGEGMFLLRLNVGDLPPGTSLPIVAGQW